MRDRKIMAVRRLVPLVGLLLAASLGGCVAYTGYPSDRYGYNDGYRSNDYAYQPGYSYTTTYNEPAYYPNDVSHYPPVYFGPFNPNADGGGGG
jgi:hypothetical protein